MALIQSTAIPSGATDYELEQSLKFNDDDSAYLSWTPASAGNRKTFTWSGWVKLSNTTNRAFFGAYDGNNAIITKGSKIQFEQYDTVTNYYIKTSAVLRDFSAWYHIVAVWDTSNSTSSDRIRLYINGERATDLAGSDYPALNYDHYINGVYEHRVGHDQSGSRYMDGYMAEVNFIDGQALTPSSFGETGDYGEWKPIEYSGSYGTNGFYLPFKQDYSVEGFSTVTYKGTGASQYVGGVGFNPDLIWIKRRDATAWHTLVDTVRGTTKSLATNATTAEDTDNIANETDGLTIGTGGAINTSGSSMVAWNWDMGGSNATNTNGSITSTVRANPTYGQSIVSFDLNGSTGGTTGHGLSSAPELIIFKNREFTSNWHTFIPLLGNNKLLTLNTTSAASTNTEIFKNTAPTSTVFSFGNKDEFNANANDNAMIAYCFHSVTGYSKFGSYTGNASTNAVTTGFAPAFVMLKDTTGSGHSWEMHDSVRGADFGLLANYSDAENTSGTDVIDFTDTGFTLKNSNGNLNGSGNTYIYMAFADKREYAYWLDQSGNNNDWTSNNLTESDISVDSPTNNFATWNPLSNLTSPTISEGNLKIGTGDSKALTGTFGVSTGKWYWEVNTLNTATYGPYLGVTSHSQENDPDSSPLLNGTTGRSAYRVSSTPSIKNYTSTSVTDDSAHGLAEYGLRGLALDLDNGTLKYYVNNTLYHTDTTIPSDGTTVYPYFTHTGSGGLGWNSSVTNFGQDSSFAGTKTAQGNQDSNDIGDFYYTPPTGYLALCTKNLPDVDVVPSEHFNTVLYTGNGSTQSIPNGSTSPTSIAFQPDFTWTKSRSNALNHNVYDAIRGATKLLKPNLTVEEGTDAQSLKSFDSNGFTVGTDSHINTNGATFVSWNWKANGSGSSNTNGTINSTVSANVDAGFSIVSYTGNETAGATIGHGLSKAPEMIIVKNRTLDGEDWRVYHSGIASDAETDFMNLNTGAAAADNAAMWNDTAPSATLITLGGDAATNGDEATIAYAFHSVDGYSKVGSYTGNGSTDGTFVYTGFKPAWVMIKRVDIGDSWAILDNNRNDFNPADDLLYAERSDAEAANQYAKTDFVSNGFKLRALGSTVNNSSTSNNYIYIAFAETPFKYSNAR